MAAYTDVIQQLYVAYFNRPADVEGLNHWEKVLVATRGDIALVSSAFTQSPEYLEIIAGKSHAQIVNQIYINLFNRGAEPDGLAFWSARLREGTFSVDQIVKVIADSASDAEARDRSTYAHKVAAATAFTSELDNGLEIISYSNGRAIESAKIWLSTIGDSASLEYALAPDRLKETVRIITASGGVVPFVPKLLTKGVDTLEGTWSNDVFEGTVSSDPVLNTLHAQDTIDGGGGVDHLRILGESGTLALPNVNGVEIVDLANLSATGNMVLKPAALKGVESIRGHGAGQLTIDLSVHEGAAIRVVGGDGADTLIASAGAHARADELFGGWGDDTLHAGSNGARLTGGGGKDLFVLAPAGASAGTNEASTYSVVKDFSAEDLLQLKWLNGGAVASVTAFAKLGANLNASTAVFSDFVKAAISQAHAGEAVWLAFQNNAYVVVDSGAESDDAFVAGQDLIIQLSGVNLDKASFNETYGTVALA